MSLRRLARQEFGVSKEVFCYRHLVCPTERISREICNTRHIIANFRGPSWPRLRIAVENRITGTIERVETDLRLPVGVLEMD